MTTLGRYQIFEQLGTGSMGTVYRAQDTILEREVALKTIRTEGEVYPELRERFYREARACARLQHPSIVVVHDLGEIDRVAYIAMELLNGADFRKLIEQRVDIPLTVKLEAMAQICDALSYAHRQGIVHRDVKPSNLFLIQKRHAKVLDFGIAHLPSSLLTVEGRILGTPNYMAPEQILGKPSDVRSDLFSAAVVFFEFLAYAHPFNCENIPRRIVEDTPDALGAPERRLPVLLERVFARGLAKDPDRRYRTGDEFAADLRALADALLQNASPSFSRTPLPSEREVAGRPAPPSQDLYEHRLSELMQLIPEFEGAIAVGDTTLARQILVRLEAIGTADSRFSEPVRLCRARIAGLGSPAGSADARVERGTTGSSSATPPVKDPGTGLKTCGYCGAANRSAAVYCIKCGARLPAGMPAVPEPSPTPVMPQAETQPNLEATAISRNATTVQPVQTWQPERGASGEGAAVASAPALEAQQPAPPAPDRPASAEKWTGGWWQELLESARKQRQVVWLAAGLLAAIVLMIVVAVAFQPPQVKPSRIFALVAPGHALLYAEPSAGSKNITVLKGEKINILKMPQGRNDLWVPVQLVREKKVFRPGYMHAGDLQKWYSPAAADQLALIELFQAGETGSDAQIRSELDELQQLVYRSSDPQVEMASRELFLAQHTKAAGQPDVVWKALMESARQHVEAGRGVPELASAVANCQREIAALAAESAAAPVGGPSAPLPSPAQMSAARKKAKIADLLSKAQGLWRSDPDQAEQYVDQILEMQSDNKDAKELQEKIRQRKEFLAK